MEWWKVGVERWCGGQECGELWCVQWWNVGQVVVQAVVRCVNVHVCVECRGPK